MHAQRGLQYLGLCVCLSVCVSVESYLTQGASVCPENAVTYSAGNKGQKICGDLPETTAFKSNTAKHERKSQYANYSDLPDVSFLRLTQSEASEGYPRIVNNIQSCPKRCLLMQLARVGARTDSTMCYRLQRKAWPISAHTHWHSTQEMQYALSVALVVLFIYCLSQCPVYILQMRWDSSKVIL